MAERSVSAFNREYRFPYLTVFADRNRVEKEETFEISSAARDRFMLEVSIEAPADPADQRRLICRSRCALITKKSSPPWSGSTGAWRGRAGARFTRGRISAYAVSVLPRRWFSSPMAMTLLRFAPSCVRRWTRSELKGSSSGPEDPRSHLSPSMTWQEIRSGIGRRTKWFRPTLSSGVLARSTNGS
jgi:hypothetical protein